MAFAKKDDWEKTRPDCCKGSGVGGACDTWKTSCPADVSTLVANPTKLNAAETAIAAMQKALATGETKLASAKKDDKKVAPTKALIAEWRTAVKNYMASIVAKQKEIETEKKEATAAQNKKYMEYLAASDKVKAELTSLDKTNNTYVEKILAEKKDVKGLKADVVKELEARTKGLIVAQWQGSKADLTGIIEDIKECRDLLAGSIERGKKIQGEHSTWYLTGPRAGIAPILKKFNLGEKDLAPKDAETFSKALHAMSGAANEFKKIWDVDIRTASESLIARLNNLESALTKGAAEALADVRKNLKAECEKLVQLVAKAEAELKLVKTQELIADLKKPDSAAYIRLKAHPDTIKVEMESNKTRLGNIPKYLEIVQKQVSRLKKGVPGVFVSDGEIQKLFQQMEGLEKTNASNLATGKALLESSDAALAKFGK